MRNNYMLPYAFSYGGSKGRKLKPLELVFTESNGNVVVDSWHGNPEAMEVFRSEVMNNFQKRSEVEKHLLKRVKGVQEKKASKCE